MATSDAQLHRKHATKRAQPRPQNPKTPRKWKTDFYEFFQTNVINHLLVSQTSVALVMTTKSIFGISYKYEVPTSGGLNSEITFIIFIIKSEH